MTTPLLDVRLDGLRPLGRGKVRDSFEVGDDLLLVTSDRVSAFDVVMNQGIAHKGRVLTHVSRYWFEELSDLLPHHMITTDVEAMPDAVRRHADVLAGRAMLCRRAAPLPVEFVVRGYLAGSGLSDYRATGSICGVALPAGLVESSRFDAPILTPTTKAAAGHDEPMTFAAVEETLGAPLARRARDAAIGIFEAAHARAAERGLLLADTKFEFGLIDDELVWIDEALTPDSSRYWSADRWKEGEPQQPYDKQVLRNHLLSLDWDRTPPPPELSEEILTETSRRYLEVAEILTGSSAV